MVDGVYRFSLDIYQVVDLGIKVGKEYTEAELEALELESQFGKVYARALAYCLMRPHSGKEVRDYLRRKTLPVRTSTGDMRMGVRPEVVERVYDRLCTKGYIDDEKFARYWVENRCVKKGISSRMIQSELRAKGVDSQVVQAILAMSARSDLDELKKVIAKKRVRYSDDKKLIAYLSRKGFGYDDIKACLHVEL
jgi:regulatory protein